jgi:elongation factor G
MIEVEPLARGAGFEFSNEIDEQTIPTRYLAAIERGVRDTLDSGPLIGYPLTDIRVRLTGGSYDEEDSTEMAFGVSASMAIRKAAAEGQPVLLEPIMELEVVTPEAYVGDAISDLNSKRAKITGVNTEKGIQMVRAQVPLAEMFGYSTSLRSATQGRAHFTMQFLSYDSVPGPKAALIIKKIRGI